MKTRTTLVAVLFLFTFGPGVFGVAANEIQRPSYYYGSAPYEYGYPDELQTRYPEYMPREFGRQPEAPQIMQASSEYIPPDAGGLPVVSTETVLPDFMPYDEARERFSDIFDFDRDAAPPPPRWDETPAATRDYPEIADMDGFIPYEYARERYSN